MQNQNAPLGIAGSKMLASDDFAKALGHVTFLMSVSPAHRDLPLRSLEGTTMTALLLKQYKLFFKKKQPVAFIAWAAVTDEVKAALSSGDHTMQLTDWRGGKNVVVVDCVSPFADAEKVKSEFMASVDAAET